MRRLSGASGQIQRDTSGVLAHDATTVNAAVEL